jgi:hypothetical protein
MNTNLFRKDVGAKGQGILQHSGHSADRFS